MLNSFLKGNSDIICNLFLCYLFGIISFLSRYICFVSVSFCIMSVLCKLSLTSAIYIYLIYVKMVKIHQIWLKSEEGTIWLITDRWNCTMTDWSTIAGFAHFYVFFSRGFPACSAQFYFLLCSVQLCILTVSLFLSFSLFVFFPNNNPQFFSRVILINH